MAEQLLSVGLDVGTTSTQMIVSRLEIANQAGSFSVPEMAITRREICYRSPVYFTPLLSQDLVDGDGIREIVAAEYGKAGICRENVDTGAVIITGETSRKENAHAVLRALADYAGDFVVATAGPDLESILAARGAGAVDFSETTGKTVLHMDIGGGTSNLALIRAGVIEKTGCLNVGGRLVKLDDRGTVTYLSPVLEGLTDLKPGQRPDAAALERTAEILTHALEMAAGLRPPTALLDTLTTAGTASRLCAEGVDVISFSGGVADCIGKARADLEFGDIGPALGRAIRRSRLCTGVYRLGDETIRATVIGAGCHSAQLSGSTVFCRNVPLPLKNLPVVCLTEQAQNLPRQALVKRIREKLRMQDSHAVLALPGFSAPAYDRVKALASAIAEAVDDQVIVALEQDMAKALGQAIALAIPPERGCLCIDRVKLAEGSYLDVGSPVGPALPVVVKTLILSR